MSDEQKRELFLTPSRLRTLIKQKRALGPITLRGAVVDATERSGRMRVVVRDSDYRTWHATEVVVPVLSPPPRRGMEIDVHGKLIAEEGRRNTWKNVLVGTVQRIGDKSEGLLRRELHAQRVREREGGRQALPTGYCDKLHVVTSLTALARGDIEGALRDLSARRPRLPEPQLVRCNLASNKSIASALRDLREQVKLTHVVLVARGGGDREWLDHFEHEDVITGASRARRAMSNLHSDRPRGGRAHA